MNTNVKPKEYSARTRCVLLVHGNELFREALALLLQWKTSFKRSLQASCPEEARSLLGELREGPDLAILDLDALPLEYREDPGRIGWLTGVPVVGLTSGKGKYEAAEGCVILSVSSSAEKIVAAARELGERG
ncbi:MAG: hypothetical protein K6T51_05650 [Rubrobacteraceae bacterium]|uniref:hypothetical protein n=1 Tax=Rubrobacter naiadicus TaxID=1392641 RepID=UPI0023628201|nr:hypothetical protein [Rubrobacter naiadicus]MBX6762147.1 hypothetical protein [Rubrobacteraceae bacterium]MCL6438071.1 hypothetical protein [Rubrobacteraceae bacterium]